jgi:hypothetical protein
MTFLVETPHTKEECLKVLDEELALGPDVLKKTFYGCAKGNDHTGYAIVDVKNEAEARKIVPGFLVSKASIIEVGQFTPEMIRSFHSQAA